MIITISGNYGSGKSTVAGIIEKKLGMKRLYIGEIMRSIAKRRGVSLIELQNQAKTDPSVDAEVDKSLIEFGKDQNNFVIDSHLAYHFIPHSIKIFLRVDEKEGAKRIFSDKSHIRETENYNKSINETIENMRKRRELTRNRWFEVYGTDFTDPKNYDYIIDSTNISPEEVADKIIKFAKNSQKSSKS